MPGVGRVMVAEATDMEGWRCQGVVNDGDRVRSSALLRQVTVGA